MPLYNCKSELKDLFIIALILSNYESFLNPMCYPVRILNWLDTEYFDIVAGVLQGDTLAPYLFIICLDYVLRTSIDKIRENGFELTKKRSRRYPAKTITDADYADDIAILANTPDQAETLLHSLERAAAGIGLYVNEHKTEYMCYNQTGGISTLEGTPLKLVDKFTYLGSSVESTEKDIETRLMKAWTAINRLSIIWKSDLTDKMKRSFFQAAVTSILLYGYTTWTLTKRLEKKLDGNYTRMLRAILNKSWRQHPTRHQLYGHLPPITKTIRVRRTRHAGHCWRSRDELIRDVLLWTPTHGRAKAGRPARTYIQQLCEDTGCCPEDLPEAMNDREEWRERVRDIRATSATWCLWWRRVKSAQEHYKGDTYFVCYRLAIRCAVSGTTQNILPFYEVEKFEIRDNFLLLTDVSINSWTLVKEFTKSETQAIPKLLGSIKISLRSLSEKLRRVTSTKISKELKKRGTMLW